MSTLDDKARARLIALLGMLGSEHAGERDAAAVQAEALRRKLGMSWAELMDRKLLVVPKVVYVDREVVVERERVVVRDMEVWLPFNRASWLVMTFLVTAIAVAVLAIGFRL